MPDDVEIGRIAIDIAGGQRFGGRDVDRGQTPARGLRGIDLLIGGFPVRSGAAGDAERQTNGKKCRFQHELFLFHNGNEIKQQNIPATRGAGDIGAIRSALGTQIVPFFRMPNRRAPVASCEAALMGAE